MLSTASSGGSNPFASEERENFPQWSPLFSQTSSTPSSLKKMKGFHWSIDQMAKLKPVDIATSPASLAVTNVTSPHDNALAQMKADEYFSQRNILPSPWTAESRGGGVGGGGGGGGSGGISKAKHVTFSPLPPTTSYYHSEENRKVDASTQTALTIPVNFDLEKILGQEFYTAEDNSFTLRRKLFGHPRRDSDGCHGDERPNPEDGSYIEPRTHDTQLSSTPVRNSSVSPAVYITKLSAGDPSPSQPPLSSSFLGKCGSSPLLSPIMTNDLLQLSPIPTGGIRNGSGVGSAPPLSPPTLSPITSTGSGRPRDIYNTNTINGDFAGIGKEIHVHISDESINDGDQLDQDLIPQASPMGTAQSKIIKRHILSPRGSPVLKQQCIYCSPTRPDIAPSPPDPAHPDSALTSSPLPPVLHLTDLQSEDPEDSVIYPSSSSLPPSACTTYFKNLALEETAEKALLSGVSSSWQPNIHSTMLEGARGMAPPQVLSSVSGTLDSGVGFSDVSVPSKTTPTSSAQSSPVPPPLPHSLLPSRLKLSSVMATPTSRYEKSPFAPELVRKKNYFKAKLNFKSPVKQAPLRTPLQEHNLSLSPSL